MARSGALTRQQAATMFGRPSAADPDAYSPEWVFAAVGLSDATDVHEYPGLHTRGRADKPDDLLAAALAARGGPCAGYPDAARFTRVARPTQLTRMRPPDRMKYAVALSLAAPCRPQLSALIDQAGASLNRDTRPVMADRNVAFSLYTAWAETEATCALTGRPGAVATLLSEVDRYAAAATNAQTPPAFQALDLYAVYRIRDLASTGCRGGWWNGLS
jgi:hypothetical protein